MRVLVTSTPGQGHVQPMLPLALALGAAGHTVAIAVAADQCASLEAAELTAIASGRSLESWFGELDRRHPTRPWTSLPEVFILQWFVPRLFGEIGAPAMLDDLARIVGEWRPDLVVCETYELAGPVCAHTAGIPWVHHTVGPPLADDVLRLAAASTAPLWHQQGLDSPMVAGEDAALCLDICPRSMRNSHTRNTVTALPLRAVAAPPSRDEALPPSMSRLPHQPTVHATLGTSVTNSDQSVLATIIAGLRDEPVNLVVTVGPGNQPERLGPQPDNVCIERYIAHALLLPRCALVVTHGGAGTMFAALRRGLPLLTIPQGADQYVNAEVCARRGVGRTLVTRELTPAAVRREVHTLLEDASYRRRAHEVQAEIARMPSPQEAVGALERLCLAAA